MLIKSIAQAIPTYAMSIYLFPLSLYEEIQRMLNSFLSGVSSTDSKGIEWLSWDKMVVSNEYGGLISGGFIALF